jgi:hypothetical protein
MNIEKIIILIRPGFTDCISVYTDLPSPYEKGISSDNLVMAFETPKGKGIDYVKDVFGDITERIELIDIGKSKNYVIKGE